MESFLESGKDSKALPKTVNSAERDVVIEGKFTPDSAREQQLLRRESHALLRVYIRLSRGFLLIHGNNWFHG